MGKLIFRYGTMGSAKSANLLTTAYNFEERGKHVICIKPIIDTRTSVDVISSRIQGLQRKCYPILKDEDVEKRVLDIIADHSFDSTIVLVDEVQFFEPTQIDQLVRLVDDYGLFIICYGLRTTSAGKLFAGAARLFEVCDKIEEIKSVCDCGRKTIINAKINSDGTFNYSDDVVVDIGGNEKYKAVCRKCWTSGRVHDMK